MERGRFTDRPSPGLAGLRAVAVLEAAKGIIVLLLGLGVFALIHTNLDADAEEITALLHVNPEGRLSRIFLGLANRTTSRTLWLVAVGALAYTAVRFTEAYGLWRRKEWAQWFALLSGALYLPGELYSLWRHSTLLKWTIFATNTTIVLWILQLRVRDRAITKRNPQV